MGGVSLTLGALLVGYEPVGDDPAWMYRPIKSELARAFRSGGLPFWSDRFGVGVPLVAESHAGAFYPPNWLLYRALDVPVAYRLAMWLHYTATACLAYLYGRTIGLQPWGAALAAASFSLCGFQATHAVHECFYHTIPFLLLSLTIAEAYLARGGIARLTTLALALGAALTIGQFQIQTWTAGLVMLTGIWRALGREAPWRRVAALAGAVAWAAAVAAAQLVLTWELVHFIGFSRSISDLFLYSFPPAHWAQLAFPGIFHQHSGPAQSAYWHSYASSAREVCLHVGVVPLILAAIGLFARKDRAMVLWCWLAALGFALATLPVSWGPAYALFLRIPGLVLFRCPARYTLLTSLGLCLLAGLGFDRLLSRRRFWSGIALATVFAGAATAWLACWTSESNIFAGSDGDIRLVLLPAGIVSWLVALALVVAWRNGRVPHAILFLVAMGELAFWFYSGPTRWGRSIPMPGRSPLLATLAREPSVGLVGGIVCDVPVLAGWTTGDPYLGIPGPGPNPRLDMVMLSRQSRGPARALLPRLGVTHGIFDVPDPFLPAEVLYRGRDPVLDLTMPAGATSGPRIWRLERYPAAFPAVRVATRSRAIPDWSAMLLDTASLADPNLVYFQEPDAPAETHEPRARSAKILRWDGHSGEVESDGTCDLVLRRACYPGWRATLDDGRDAPIVPADGGLQSIRLQGSGITRVAVTYRPSSLVPAACVSGAAIAIAAVAIMATAARDCGPSRGRPTPPDPRASTEGPG